jgi:hypothetical protein
MPWPSGRGGIRFPAERGRGSRIAAGRSGVGPGSGEGDLQEVQDLGVEGPSVRSGAGGHLFVQVCRDPE